MQSFKVIEVKENEYDGDSCTSSDVLNAMKFSDYATYVREEKEKRELILKLVKTHFPKKNHTISYRTLNIEVK